MSTSLVLKQYSTTDVTHMSTSLVLKQNSTTDAKHLNTSHVLRPHSMANAVMIQYKRLNVVQTHRHRGFYGESVMS